MVLASPYQALVPAGTRVLRTGRKCHWIRLREKPLRPIVDEVRDWLTTELRDDVRAANELYPELDLI